MNQWRFNDMQHATTLARPADVMGASKDDIAMMSFLVRYKEPTRSGYALALKHWFRWCREKGITPLTATRPYLEVWCREMDEHLGLKASTINGKLNAVSGFYKFAKIDGYIVDNPCDHLNRPKVPSQSTTQGLTRSELLHCLDTAAKTDPQDYALWCFLGLNGVRISEACGLDAEILDWSNGYRTVKVTRAKTAGRVDELPLCPRTSRAFDLHLGTRTTGPVFMKPRKEERLDQKSANRIVHRIAREAGIEKRVTPHSLRHTFTTLALNAGVPLRDIANSRGDTDLRQISYYDRDKGNLSRNATHMVAAFVDGS